MGKINVYDKIMIENQKREKIWKSNFYTHAKSSCCQRERWHHLPCV